MAAVHINHNQPDKCIKRYKDNPGGKGVFDLFDGEVGFRLAQEPVSLSSWSRLGSLAEV
jgi:hypothetical protein